MVHGDDSVYMCPGYPDMAATSCSWWLVWLDITKVGSRCKGIMLVTALPARCMSHCRCLLESDCVHIVERRWFCSPMGDEVEIQASFRLKVNLYVRGHIELARF
ncbi:hypothetical protein M8C21_033465 [Ambrosia artemisiifolia]|uniref:Uncharacterized protein n=1 Tax=Ambrosia artemisiifolia TaxID=4212 RepID=A0AAD5CPW3_AMBAR|nr:hypothetical protein M8C21_033465 [Ambrosia artemisiifolia]